jgi:hypothetical protein
MKVLVVGSSGGMGRRYCAILRHMKIDLLEADIGDLWWEWEWDRVIIATPTVRHVRDIRLAATIEKPILCEKPISKSCIEGLALTNEMIRLNVDVRMVSNWRFAINRALERVGEIAVLGEMDIEYNHYNSGNDGFFWDCIQLLMMAGRFKYDHSAPVFDCKVNGNPVTLDDISHSYPMMISEWLYGDKEKLWSLRQAAEGFRLAAFAESAGALPIGEINLHGQETR